MKATYQPILSEEIVLVPNKESEIPDIATTYLKLDASNDPITGDLKLVPTANSTTTFQIFKQDGTTNVFNVDTTNGRVGIGTILPTNSLSFGGNSARTIALERHTTTDTVGNGLTIKAGDATSGATDKGGGPLVLSSGSGTGNNSGSSIQFYTSVPTTAGTGDQTLNTRLIIHGVTNTRISIGNGLTSSTTDTTDGLNFLGTIGQNIYHKRHTAVNTAGNILNIQAGGARSAATDKDGGDLYLKGGISTGTGSSAIRLFTTTAQASTNTTDNAPTEKMTILGKGFVGIGTTNPNSILEVLTTTSGGPQFTKSSGNFYTRFGRPGNAADANGIITWDDTNKQLQLMISGDVAGSSLNIANGGNVGIGITAPTAKLHIVGSDDTRQLIIKGNATQTTNLVEWQNSGATVLCSINGLGGAVFNSQNAATTVQIGGATNNSTFESDGTLVFNGTATVFDDVRVNLSNIKAPAANPPTWTTYKSCEVPAFALDATNVLYFTAQLPHGYKQGSNIGFHIHVAYPDNAAGNSRWKFTYSWANIDGTFAAATTETLTFASSTVADSHTIHAFTDIVGTGKNISSVLLCSISRLGADGADTYANVIYAVSADLHVELDTVGSRTTTAK